MKEKFVIGLFVFCLAGAGERASGSEPLLVTIEKSNGESTPAYILKATERAILWKYTPESGASNTTALADIKSIDFDPPDELAEAERAFDGGDYAKAAEVYGMVAEKYKDIMVLAKNPAARAKYLEIESYRRLGKLDKVSELLTDEIVGVLRKALDPQFGDQLAIDHAWAASVAGNWDVVNHLIAEKSLPKGEGVGRAPEFKKELSPAAVVQLAYLRALSLEAAGDAEAALNDYYRVFTLGFGNDRALSGQAMLKALGILAADAGLAEDEVKLKETQALAMIYRDAFGGGNIPAEFAKYAAPAPAKEEAEAPAPEAAPEGGAVEGAAPAGEGSKEGEGGAEAKPAAEGESKPAVEAGKEE